MLTLLMFQQPNCQQWAATEVNRFIWRKEHGKFKISLSKNSTTLMDASWLLWCFIRISTRPANILTSTSLGIKTSIYRATLLTLALWSPGIWTTRWKWFLLICDSQNFCMKAWLQSRSSDSILRFYFGSPITSWQPMMLSLSQDFSLTINFKSSFYRTKKKVWHWLIATVTIAMERVVFGGIRYVNGARQRFDHNAISSINTAFKFVGDDVDD